MKKRLLWLHRYVDPNNYWEGISNTDAKVYGVRLPPQNSEMIGIYKAFTERVDKSRYEEFEVENLENMKIKAIEIGKQDRIDGVFTTHEPLLKLAAQIAKELGVAHNSIESLTVSQNKWLQREVFKKNDVPSPNFALIKEENDIKTTLKEISYPVILKPVYGSGSYHVEEFTDEQRLINYYRKAVKSYNNVWTEDPKVFYLLEEKLIGVSRHNKGDFGTYISVESLIEDGEVMNIAITDKFPLYSSFRETGSIMPSQLPDNVQKEAFEVAEKAIKAVGLTMGSTHIEMMMTNGGIKVIELNARPGGGTANMLRLNAGYDLNTQLARLALGIPIERTIKFTGFASMVHIHVSKEPYKLKITKVSGLLEASSIEGVDVLFQKKHVGDIVTPENGRRDSFAYSFIAGNSFEQLYKRIKSIKSKININYEILS